MNKRQPKNWPLITVVLLAVSAAFAVGAYVATKFVSPCVCVCMQGQARIE